MDDHKIALTIILDWSDVPKGCSTNSGTLALNVISDNQLATTQKTGGFSGSKWVHIARTACLSSRLPTGTAQG